MGKLTISMAIFNSKLLNYQRVCQLQTADDFWSYHVISIFSLRDFRFKMRNTHTYIYRENRNLMLFTKRNHQPVHVRLVYDQSPDWRSLWPVQFPECRGLGANGICKNHGLMALKWQRPCIRTSRVECARHHSEFSISGIYHRWDVSEIRWDIEISDFWYLYLSPRIYHSQSRFL